MDLLTPHPIERVDKPWGHEEIFAVVEGRYVGKALHVRAGQPFSLQWHHDKDETIAVLSGRVEFDLGHSSDDPRTTAAGPGETVHVPTGLWHRARAVTDAVLVEASTTFSGWREDVVRLEEGHGRGGTSAP